MIIPRQRDSRFGTGRWSADEHNRFLEAYECFQSWEQVARHVGTRSTQQCISHDQKLRKKKERRDASGPPFGSPRQEHFVPENYGRHEEMLPRNGHVGASVETALKLFEEYMRALDFSGISKEFLLKISDPMTGMDETKTDWQQIDII